MGQANMWHAFRNLTQPVQILGWVLLFPLIAALAFTRGKLKPAGRLVAGIGVFAITGVFWIAPITSFTPGETQTTSQAPDAPETETALAERADENFTGSDPGANEPGDEVEPGSFTKRDTVPQAGEVATPQPRAPPNESTDESTDDPTDGELVASLLEELTVGREQPAGYNRNLFTHWITQDGCTTRNAVLIRDAANTAQLGSGCTVTAGSWYSPFDGTWIDNPRSLDIDHLVPLAEAWRSGARNWDQATRRAFANELSDPRTLIAVSASSNRSKSDRDPANWLPPNTSYRCTYIGAWVAVKHRWQLTIDSQEQTAIRQELNNCGALRTAASVAARPTQGPPPAPTPMPSPSPSPAPAPAPSPATCVDINTASLDELQKIVHIGTSRANALISLRPFSSLEDLERISGIGPARVADIQNEGIACAR